MSTPQPKKKLVLKKKAPGAKKTTGKKKAMGKTKKSTTGEQKTGSLPPPIVKAPPPAEAPPPAPAPEAETIEPPPSAPKHEFYCPYCAKLIDVTTDQVGEEISCPGCSEKIWVPPPPKGQTAHVDPPPPAVFKFFCSLCGQKLSAPVNAGGTQSVCPACNGAITVPQHQPPPEIAED
jgi:DNA-directed RNA polymerase subunit RPC12/RpoP